MSPAAEKALFIRVDHKRNLFDWADPGFICIDDNRLIKDALKEIQSERRRLSRLDLQDFEVYKLRTPLRSIIRRRSARILTTDTGTTGNAATADAIPNTFESLKTQIETVGMINPLLETIYQSDTVDILKFDERPGRGYISFIIYHPPLPEDYPAEPQVEKRPMQAIAEKPTFETARIEDLKKLGSTTPRDSTGRGRYDHIFMGHPHSHRTLPVALYDPILALLAYKLERLDICDNQEAERLFPDAAEFRGASLDFSSDAARDYSSEKRRSRITFNWLNAVFGKKKCKEQVHIRVPTTKAKASTATKRTWETSAKAASSSTSSPAISSDTSTGSRRAYTIPDGDLLSIAVNPEADDDSSVDAMVTQLVATDKATRILSLLIAIKLRYGDAVLQAAKVFARFAPSLHPWIIRQTWFPTMIFTAEGHLVRVAILVNVGATLVQKLVLLDINSMVPDNVMITRLERIASALHACSDQLDEYYKSLSKEISPEKSRSIRFPRPTLEPSANPFTPLQSAPERSTTNTTTPLQLPVGSAPDQSTKIPFSLQSALGGPDSYPQLEFKSYLQRDGGEDLSWINMNDSPSEKARIMRGLFVAEMIEKPGEAKQEVAVKFAETYSAEAHECLHELGIAPKLHYHRRVVGKLIMIVMERVKGQQWSELGAGDVSQSAIDRLSTQIEEFHRRDFVHGDLRECNVMLDSEGRPMVIDFDWAGKQGAVRYPKNINMDLVGKELDPEVNGGLLLHKKHDKFAYEVLQKKVSIEAAPAADDAPPTNLLPGSPTEASDTASTTN